MNICNKRGKQSTALIHECFFCCLPITHCHKSHFVFHCTLCSAALPFIKILAQAFPVQCFFLLNLFLLENTWGASSCCVWGENVDTIVKWGRPGKVSRRGAWPPLYMLFCHMYATPRIIRLHCSSSMVLWTFQLWANPCSPLANPPL